MKATAVAPANIAFIKYWGLEDANIRLPTNGSISMNLSNLTTTTTVEFSDQYTQDDVDINGKKEVNKIMRVIEQLDRVRKLAHIPFKAKIVSKNSFPTGTGLSSSASGFAALTVAAVSAAGLILSEKKLTILARQASGSACRSIPDGFVEWVKGEDSDSSYAYSIFPPDWWDIADIVVSVSKDEKQIPTTQAQYCVHTSPFFKTRLTLVDDNLKKVKKLLQEKKFPQFGELIEAEALELHAIMFTSNPPLIYLYPETLKLINIIKQWRSNGITVYFSLNTGHNLHLICLNKHVTEVEKNLSRLSFIKQIIINTVSIGTRLTAKHLF